MLCVLCWYEILQTYEDTYEVQNILMRHGVNDQLVCKQNSFTKTSDQLPTELAKRISSWCLFKRFEVAFILFLNI